MDLSLGGSTGDVKARPTTWFFDSKGREFTRRGGYIPAPEFKKLLDDLKRAGASDPASSPSAI